MQSGSNLPTGATYAASKRNPPKGQSARERMRRKLRTKRGRERYALRMERAEPVFGQIKQGRGLRQFLLRGLEKVNREWLLICAGHNLRKLFRFGAGRPGNALCRGSNLRSPGSPTASSHGPSRYSRIRTLPPRWSPANPQTGC